MSAIKDFEEFIRNGIVKKQSPDKSRAKYLEEESEKAYKFLQKKVSTFGITDETANDLVRSCYDILMESIRAKMLIKGYNASGQGAHEAEVSYLRNLGFKEKDVQFADQLRYFRNGMLYYGTSLEKEYAQKIIEFTDKIYFMLLNSA
ncbi:hypothetical protein COV13_02325 [Candidatus Woesearchaeota archaeon CG10_big_fil_rev_8_21_14_0_10_32_9]|nr:MAG: hypothetical protein COV13_02325 [Candidatus Woesearchaeota archaeon CG10_big_fil_rev_8_21_14_0_10_32_9]